MSDQEGFLQRWSRRKSATGRDAGPRSENQTARPSEQVPARPSEGGDPAFAKENAVLDPRVGEDEREGRALPDEAAPIDLSQLPSLDSITEATDLRVFLARGVPAALTREALRRAWSADPAIRDFIGPSENSWDFNAPDGVPGFGPISVPSARAADEAVRFSRPELDLAEADDSPQPASAPLEQPASQPSGSAADAASQTQSQEIATICPRGDEAVGNSDESRSQDIAEQQNQDVALRETSKAVDLSDHSARRRHGRALPE